MQCPFTYANGKRCDGEVDRARAYGKHSHGLIAEHDIKKIRLWCSIRWDHAGAVSSFATKGRMEFYPDELAQRGLYDKALDLCENVNN